MVINSSNQFEDALVIDFINVGFGDCTYIEFKGKNKYFNMLVDAGRPGTEHFENNPQRIRAVDYLRERNIYKLNLMVITHFHEDHTGGFKEIVENVGVETLWCNYPMSEKYRGVILIEYGEFPDGPHKLLNAINIYNHVYFTFKDRNTNICPINKGYDYSTGVEGLNISVLWPNLNSCLRLASYVDVVYNSNNTSQLAEELDKLDKCLNDFCIILKVSYQNTSLLLAGDGGEAFWSKFETDEDISSAILKLPHHGQIDSFSEKLFSLANPKYVVISAANDWTYRCPNRNAVEQILDYGQKSGRKCSLFFTDAIDMAPYTTKEDIKNFIRFHITGNGVVGINKLTVK